MTNQYYNELEITLNELEKINKLNVEIFREWFLRNNKKQAAKFLSIWEKVEGYNKKRNYAIYLVNEIIKREKK